MTEQTNTNKQVVSMGRVVIYNHRDDNKIPIKSPAIVQEVCMTDPKDQNIKQKVNLFVMSNAGRIFFPREVEYGEEAGKWNWPSRV